MKGSLWTAMGGALFLIWGCKAATTEVPEAPAQDSTIAGVLEARAVDATIIEFTNVGLRDAAAKAMHVDGVGATQKLDHVFPGLILYRPAREVPVLAELPGTRARVSVRSTTREARARSSVQPFSPQRATSLALKVRVYVVDSGAILPRAGRSSLGGVAGWSYDGELSRPDCIGHGTAVAETIAEGDPQEELALVLVRAIGCTGDDSIIPLLLGLDWILGQERDRRPYVVNLSLNASSPLISRAIKAIVESGGVVVTAAGNDGIDACAVSAATVRGVLTVAALGPDGTPWPESNHGRCVDVWATGSRPNSQGTGVKEDPSTSFAAPRVAAALGRQLASGKDLQAAVTVTLRQFGSNGGEDAAALR